jgi:hypothetical protein
MNYRSWMITGHLVMVLIAAIGLFFGYLNFTQIEDRANTIELQLQNCKAPDKCDELETKLNKTKEDKTIILILCFVMLVIPVSYTVYASRRIKKWNEIMHRETHP